MSRYYFDVIDGAGGATDDDGVELQTIEDARRTAVEGARDIVAHEARNGRVDLSWRIDVRDDAGAVVFSVNFADAVKLVRPRGE